MDPISRFNNVCELNDKGNAALIDSSELTELDSVTGWNGLR